MSKTDKTLTRCDKLIERLNTLKKALNEPTQAQSNRTPAKGLGAGWSQDPSTGAFHHSSCGVISVMKHPDGHFNIVHNGKLVGVAADIGEAGMKIKRHVQSVEKTEMMRKSAPTHSTPESAIEARKIARAAAAVASGAQRSTSPKQEYTAAQLAAINEARKLKKNTETAPWTQHAQVPNADAEVEKVQRENPTIPGEDLMATQLANMMLSKAMLNPNHRQPSSEDMIMAGERMGLGANQEAIKAADEQWANVHNSWLAEAMKPISSRFSSEEEEAAYWDSIRVHGGNKNDDYGF